MAFGLGSIIGAITGVGNVVSAVKGVFGAGGRSSAGAPTGPSVGPRIALTGDPVADRFAAFENRRRAFAEKGLVAPPTLTAPPGFPTISGSTSVARVSGPDAFGVTRRRVATSAQAMSRIPAVVGRMTVLGELLQISRQTTGQVVTRQKIVDAVRHCGIELASDIFALTPSEICMIVISRPRRRSRGITAADLRRTRATIRKVHSIQHSLSHLKSPVRRRK